MRTIRNLALAAFAILSPVPAWAKGPNILFIFSDDHAYQAVSAYGSKVNKTPNIDRIAKQGARFANSFVTNSLCVPSRAAILTGKFGHLTGVRNLSDKIKPGEMHFAKLLQKAGYQTGVIGKWHLGTTPEGFDHWDVLPGQGAYYNPTFITPKGNVQETGYVTDVITDKGLAFLKGRDPSKPFLLMLHHKAPHRAWEPGPQELALYEKTKFPVPPTFFDDYRGRASPARTQKMHIGANMTIEGDLKVKATIDPSKPYRRMNAEQLRAWEAAYTRRVRAWEQVSRKDERTIALWKYQEYMKDYLRCVAGVDKSVGQMLAYLDEAGLAKDTVVVYGSDQGFYLGEHGWFDKRWIYEESVRTPMVVRWPGVTRPGTVIREMVQNLDYAQTFLEIAGVPAPVDMQGMSLVPLLRGERPRDWRRSIYYRYYDPGHSVAAHYGIRTERFTLVHFPATDEWELFDLQKDPRQIESVYDSPRYAPRLASLKDELTRLREQYKDIE